MEIPIELKNAICNNKLIVFVGAGLSYNLLNTQGEQLLGWNNLAEKILFFLKDAGHEKAENLLPILNSYEPIEILRLIELNQKFPKGDIHDFLKGFLDVENDKNDFTLHKKLCDLSSKIITTNYDTAFEIAFSTLRRFKAYKGKNYELTKHKESNSRLLFKLHGCYEDSDSMVLFPSNYDDLYANEARDAEHSLFVLNNIIANNSLLFIGTGMGDFQINTIFKKIKSLQGDYNQKHYIITNKKLDSSLDFLTPISIKDHTEISNVIDKLLKHKSDCQDEDSEKFRELEQQLKQANDRIKELETKSNPNESDLLEEEALKYFSKGLEYSLDKNYEKSIIQYKRSSELKANFSEAYNNWGTDLGSLALERQGNQSDELYNLSFEKFEKAIKIKPDDRDSFYNWGTFLLHKALTKENDEAESLFNLSFEKFEKAIQVKVDDDYSYNHWGISLSGLAKLNEGEKAERLFKQAFKKYENAISINPRGHNYYSNWGKALTNLASIKKGKEAEKIYNLALEKFKKEIENGGKYYNFSCFNIIRGQKKEALIYLKKSLENKEYDSNIIVKDEDWKDYLEDPDFLKVINQFKE